MTAKDYLGDIIGGSIMLRESRLIAQLLLRSPDRAEWEHAIVDDNILQKGSMHSARRMASTMRKRLEPLSAEFWSVLLDAQDDLARQMMLLAVMNDSPVLVDFFTTEVADARRMYRETLPVAAWMEFITARQRVISGLDGYSSSSIEKMGSNICKIMVDTGYLESARSKRFKAVYLLPELREWAQRIGCPQAYEAMEAAR